MSVGKPSPWVQHVEPDPDVIDQRAHGVQKPKEIKVTVDGPAANAAVVAEGAIVGDAPVTLADLDEVDRFVEALVEEVKRESESAEGEEEDDDDAALPE